MARKLSHCINTREMHKSITAEVTEFTELRARQEIIVTFGRLRNPLGHGVAHLFPDEP